MKQLLVYDRKNDKLLYDYEKNITSIENYEIIDINDNRVNELHEIIYSFVDQKYLDEYFTADKEYKSKLPYIFYRQPMFVNICTEFVENIPAFTIVLNNPELKWCDTIAGLRRTSRIDSISGIGSVVMSDILLNIVDKFLYSKKIFETPYFDSLVALFKVVNATIPENQRITNFEFFDYYKAYFGQPNNIDTGSLNIVLGNELITHNLNKTVNFIEKEK